MQADVHSGGSIQDIKRSADIDSCSFPERRRIFMKLPVSTASLRGPMLAWAGQSEIHG
jgi:hypothetical protein